MAYATCRFPASASGTGYIRNRQWIIHTTSIETPRGATVVGSTIQPSDKLTNAALFTTLWPPPLHMLLCTAPYICSACRRNCLRCAVGLVCSRPVRPTCLRRRRVRLANGYCRSHPPRLCSDGRSRARLPVPSTCTYPASAIVGLAPKTVPSIHSSRIRDPVAPASDRGNLPFFRTACQRNLSKIYVYLGLM